MRTFALCLCLAVACAKERPLPAAPATASVAFTNEDTQPRAPAPFPMPPAALSFSLGGDSSRSVTLDGGVVRTATVGGFGPQQGQVLAEATATPTPEAWARFAARLEEAGVWRWPETFTSAAGARTDGVGWRLELVGADGGVFSTRGYEAFPRRFGDLERALSELAGQSAAPPAQCRLSAAPPGPLPATASPGAVLDHLGFPERADEESCARWKELKAWLETHRSELSQLPRGEAPATGKKTLFRMACAMPVMTVAQSRAMSALSVSSATRAVLDAWEGELNHCGAADRRDEACERGVHERRLAQWRDAAERARTQQCLPHLELVERARQCVEVLRASPEDGVTQSERTQLWLAVALAQAASQHLWCPPTPPARPTWVGR